MTTASGWSPAGWPPGIRPSPGVVDVMTCSLDLGPRECDALARVLSTEEQRRAARLATPELRRAFVAGRARTRQFLACLLDCPPEGLRIGTDARGKPRLDGEAPPRLRFNVAHSGGLLACAATLDHEVGIDVEHVREEVECDSIARRFFAADEVRALSALPPHLRREAFFACWTRKEAVLKAVGEGLGRPLDSFAVSVHPSPAALLAGDASFGSVSDWSLLVIPVPRLFQGTVAIQRPAAALRPWLDRAA